MEKHIDVIVMNSHGVGQFCNIKRLPLLGETLNAWNWRVEEDGGKGTTVAVSLGRLGIKTAYIGKVGKDPWGDLGFKWMGDAGVDTTFMYQTDEVATGTGLVMIDEEGHSTIVDGDSSLAKLTMEEVIAALDAMKEARYFLTGFGMPWQKALQGAKIAHERGLITMCNASPLPDDSMGDISYIDYLVLNDVEGYMLSGLPESDMKEFKKVVGVIKEKCNCGTVVLTLGEDGSLIYHKGEFIYTPPVKVKVVDTTGAGDSYYAAFAANLVWGKSIAEAAAWAGKYSALKVTRAGTIPAFPYLKEAEEFITSLG
jgi:ribokinase